MRIYKFRSCNEQNFEGLKNESIYFSLLNQLNDIFEGRYEIDDKITDRFDEKLGRRLGAVYQGETKALFIIIIICGLIMLMSTRGFVSNTMHIF